MNNSTTTNCGNVILCTSFESIVYKLILEDFVVAISRQLTGWNDVPMTYNYKGVTFMLIS